MLTAVTGVAGSGKSTLARAALPVGETVVHIERPPFAGNRRSTLATYTGVLDTVRDRFAREHRVGAGLFSANGAGACTTCHGAGTVTTDLAFLADVAVTCEACRGAQYRPEALEYRWQGRSIRQVLDLTVAEARGRLDDEALLPTLDRLCDVGLGYLTLGQPLTTLSGGERQRLELSVQLERPAATYVLDEPTDGLHEADIHGLLHVLNRLVDAGSSLVVVEHHLTVIAAADWIIDLGPGAGREGGTLLFAGPPHDLLGHSSSLTAAHLRGALIER